MQERAARFEATVDVVAEPLRRYLARRTDPETAHDVLADTLLVIWRRLEDLPADAPLPWAYGVARRCLANELRSARRREHLVLRIGQEAGVQGVSSSQPDFDDTVHAALGRLRPKDRELVALWAWEGLPPREIALVLGTTPNAVSIRLHRLRRRLAQLIGDDPRKRPLPAGQENHDGGMTR